MAVLGKSKLFASPKFDPYIKSANTNGWEKWLGYFFGPMGPAILNVTIISYITVFYTDVLNMAGEGHSGLWLMLFASFPIVSKILDAITNVVMGQVIEKTRTRQGKARPWIFIAAPMLSVACILMFMVPQEKSVLQLALVVLTYNLFFSFAYTIYNMSHTLMVPLSTNNVKQRDGLSLFTNMGVNMIPGVLVSMLFPMMILPVIGVDYHKWVTTMIIIAAVALPFTVLEYFFTKERVTEAAIMAGEVESVSLGEQLKACFGTGSWVLMMLFMLAFQLMTNIQTVSLPYFCNWVLGTYNDGVTQTILSAVGKFPLGFGVFLLWPLVKKYGKRPVMIAGFSLAAGAMLLCLFFSRNLAIMLVGSMIFSIGWLPSYVASAIMADTLDYVEYSKKARVDGLTASIFTIIMTVSVGLCQGLHNLGISLTGYVKPEIVKTIVDETGKEIPVYNTQNLATQSFIAFEYIGIPMIMLVFMALIMVFLKVEGELPEVHRELTARRKAECEARGEVYISPEEKVAAEQAENDRIAEENRIRELQERCKKRGLNFDEEEAKYQAKLAAKKAKEEAKAAGKKK